jgi:nucleoside-diphosphate-sugar epimerase
MSYGHEDNLVVDGEDVGHLFIEADVRDENMYEWCEGIDVVIHLAAVAPLPDCQMNPMYAYDNNVIGTLNTIEACRKNGVKKIVFASTSAIYENCKVVPFRECDDGIGPDLIYSMSKKACEDICKSYVKNYGMDITMMRFFNVYGPHQDFRRKHPPLMGYIVKCLLADDPTFYSDGNQSRDYIYIDDLARLMHMIVDGKDIEGRSVNVAGSTINACTGKAYSVREIYDMYQQEFAKQIEPSFDDSTKFWDKYPSLFEDKYSLDKARLIKEVNKHSLGSYGTALDVLGWEPTVPMQEGITKCVRYAKHKAIKGARQ